MATWLLKPLGAPLDTMGPAIHFPETLWYGRSELGLVVKAEKEQEARQKADEAETRVFRGIAEKHPWLSPRYSSCERIR